MVMVVGAFTIMDSIGSISNIFICDLHDWQKQQNKTTMKKFTIEEIRDLYNRFFREEISFTRMVEIMNEMVNERMGKTNEPQYKDGDFVVNECGVIIIFKNKVGDSIYDHAYFSESAGFAVFSNTPSIISIERHATEKEKQKMLDELAKEGKQWNAEKKCIEDIPVPKFESGEKVQIKEDISSKTHYNVGPGFVENMDDLIGKTMIVDRYLDGDNCVACEETEYVFLEEWLESYVEDTPKRKFKKGDKVKIKEGFKPEEHRFGAEFMCEMDKYIGKDFNVDDVEWGYIISDGWAFNPDWLEPYIEDISKRKFKVGDKIRIKDGISSRTAHGQYPVFQPSMDGFIGITMTVNRHTDMCGYVLCNESSWRFHEDWLEPYTDELKKGDLAIFWDNNKGSAFIGEYDCFLKDVKYPHRDHRENVWANAIKFESIEQYKRLLKGEI